MTLSICPWSRTLATKAAPCKHDVPVRAANAAPQGLTDLILHMRYPESRTILRMQQLSHPLSALTPSLWL